MKKIRLFLVLAALLGLSTVYANIEVTMHSTIQGNEGKKLGSIKAVDTLYGLLLIPDLHDLPPGIHGFHLHEFPFCGNHGKDAGGHLDPQKTKQHQGPYSGDGHLGDMPVLIVDKKGRATLPVLVPRLRLETIKERAFMIHSGGDNYSDNPPMGGGGDRIACGAITVP